MFAPPKAPLLCQNGSLPRKRTQEAFIVRILYAAAVPLPPFRPRQNRRQRRAAFPFRVMPYGTSCHSHSERLVFVLIPLPLDGEGGPLAVDEVNSLPF